MLLVDEPQGTVGTDYITGANIQFPQNCEVSLDYDHFIVDSPSSPLRGRGRFTVTTGYSLYEDMKLVRHVDEHIGFSCGPSAFYGAVSSPNEDWDYSYVLGPHGSRHRVPSSNDVQIARDGSLCLKVYDEMQELVQKNFTSSGKEFEVGAVGEGQRIDVRLVADGTFLCSRFNTNSFQPEKGQIGDMWMFKEGRRLSVHSVPASLFPEHSPKVWDVAGSLDDKVGQSLLARIYFAFKGNESNRFGREVIFLNGRWQRLDKIVTGLPADMDRFVRLDVMDNTILFAMHRKSEPLARSDMGVWHLGIVKIE